MLYLGLHATTAVLPPSTRGDICLCGGKVVSLSALLIDYKQWSIFSYQHQKNKNYSHSGIYKSIQKS